MEENLYFIILKKVFNKFLHSNHSCMNGTVVNIIDYHAVDLGSIPDRSNFLLFVFFLFLFFLFRIFNLFLFSFFLFFFQR